MVCGCQVSADIGDKPGGGYVLRSIATTVKFPGYLAVYPPKPSAGLPPICPLWQRNFCGRLQLGYYCMCWMHL